MPIAIRYNGNDSAEKVNDWVVGPGAGEPLPSIGCSNDRYARNFLRIVERRWGLSERRKDWADL